MPAQVGPSAGCDGHGGVHPVGPLIEQVHSGRHMSPGDYLTGAYGVSGAGRGFLRNLSKAPPAELWPIGTSVPASERPRSGSPSREVRTTAKWPHPARC